MFTSNWGRAYPPQPCGTFHKPATGVSKALESNAVVVRICIRQGCVCMYACSRDFGHERPTSSLLSGKKVRMRYPLVQIARFRPTLLLCSVLHHPSALRRIRLRSSIRSAFKVEIEMVTCCVFKREAVLLRLQDSAEGLVLRSCQDTRHKLTLTAQTKHYMARLLEPGAQRYQLELHKCTVEKLAQAEDPTAAVPAIACMRRESSQL